MERRQPLKLSRFCDVYPEKVDDYTEVAGSTDHVDPGGRELATWMGNPHQGSIFFAGRTLLGGKLLRSVETPPYLRQMAALGDTLTL